VASIRKAAASRTPKNAKADKVNLEDDGLFSIALSDAAHSSPTQLHYDRAAEATGMEREMVPVCATVADLIAFVIGVKAAAGDDKAIATLLDRFSPKASRSSTEVNVSQGGGAPVSSNSKEEEKAAVDYMTSLHAV
jgi:hypothetical protein